MNMYINYKMLDHSDVHNTLETRQSFNAYQEFCRLSYLPGVSYFVHGGALIWKFSLVVCLTKMCYLMPYGGKLWSLS
jgi:hypothetical protein